MSFISLFLFISIAYSQYCPTTNKQSKCQTIKCLIYYHFINHNSQSNTLAKTIYKSQLTSHFLNSDSPTHQQPKKKSLRQTETHNPQTPHIQIQVTIILCQKKPHTHTIRDSYIILSQKKKKTTQSVNHRFTTQTLCQCYVRF